ncbi:MAG TPA: ABC transporter permease, partial [Patescibacteria group bacterium]|nr:ABC transporter permease [Patescibacteria group bacterium]
NFLVMPLFFLSGALFPLQGLPKALTNVASADPLSYSIDALRALLTNSSHFGLTHDIFILSAVTMLFLAGGSYLFSKIQI